MLVGIQELFSLVSPPSCVRRPLVNDIHYCIAFHAGVMIFDNSNAPPLKEAAVTPGLSITGSPALLLIKHPMHQLSGMRLQLGFPVFNNGMAFNPGSFTPALPWPLRCNGPDTSPFSGSRGSSLLNAPKTLH
ncbi:hypothetical protein FOBRF1_001890 [Fusarium oxysporum]